MQNNGTRNNWTREEITEIYNSPILELVYKGATVHREHHQTGEVQVCTLLSVKTGGCPEDCAYCPQAARYHTEVKVHKLLEVSEVLEKALDAKEAGSTRFCMGAAWREVRDNKDFDKVLDMVKGVSQMGMEVCCTLGMLSEEQAQKLKNAGLYDDRLDTIKNVDKANISVCSGGIIGMGESHNDRIGMLLTLANLPKHPESVPVNALVPVEGTPLEDQPRVSVWEMIRMIATARILMPKAMVRLSAGRVRMNVEEQALCFLAGANSIFAGDKLLTTPNPAYVDDKEMFQILNLKPREAYKGEVKFEQIPV